MKKIFLALCLFALAGLIASAVMTKMHADLERQGFVQKSFCNVSEFVDCDTALASRYAKVAGVPTSRLGLLYYLFFILAALYAWVADGSRRWSLSFLLAASLGALLYSLVIAYLSIVQLGVLCLLCLTTYLANLLLFVLIPRALNVRLYQVPAFLWQTVRDAPRRIGVHLIVFVLFMGAGLLVLQPGRAQEPGREIRVGDDFYLKMFYTATPRTLTLDPVTSWGDEKAPITIVEFSDFQCPYCRRAAFSLKPYLGEYRRRVRFVFVNSPLDNSCNPQITRPMHPVSCLAAKAALCAGERGGFWEFHDRIFENQKRLSRSVLIGMAKQAGMDEEWFNSCLVDPETEARLAKEIAEGAKFDLHGTPAVFINGRPFPDWNDPERLRLIIEQELKRVREPEPPGQQPAPASVPRSS